MLVAHGRVPRGISMANKELSESAIRSVSGCFYSSSEVLPYYPPPITLDTASILEEAVKDFLKDTLTKLHNLLTWNVGWNGYDALPPDPHAVAHAQDWIVKLFLEVADLGRLWIQPNVIADANGEVVFEWWYGTKKLTVYIADESAEYIQVWGTAIHSQMSDGDAEPISTCRALWLWLTRGAVHFFAHPCGDPTGVEGGRRRNGLRQE
jgi:hypothetical protein